MDKGYKKLSAYNCVLMFDNYNKFLTKAVKNENTIEIYLEPVFPTMTTKKTHFKLLQWELVLQQLTQTKGCDCPFFQFVYYYFSVEQNFTQQSKHYFCLFFKYYSKTF